MRVSTSVTLLLLVAGGAAATQTATTDRAECASSSNGAIGCTGFLDSQLEIPNEVICASDCTTKESPLVLPPPSEGDGHAGVDGEPTLSTPRTIEVPSNQKRGIHNSVKDGINVAPAGGITRRRRRTKRQSANAAQTQAQAQQQSTGMSAARKVLGGLAVAVLVAVI